MTLLFLVLLLFMIMITLQPPQNLHLMHPLLSQLQLVFLLLSYWFPLEISPLELPDLLCGLKTFITQSKSNACSYPLSHILSYYNLSSSYLTSLTAYSSVTEPSTYKDMLLILSWLRPWNLKLQH